MINIVFWFVLVPFVVVMSTEEQRAGVGVLDILYNVGAHAVPVVFLAVEMANNVVGYWNWNHFWVTMAVLVVYLVLNAVYTVTVENIYPPLTYTDWLSYVFILGCLAVVAFSYFMLTLVTRCKKKKVFKLLGLNENGK